MKGCITLSFLLITFNAFSQGEVPQVMIETEIVEVEETFVTEFGYEVGFGPSFGHFTNPQIDNLAMVGGINAFAGIDFYFHPILSVYAHFNLLQFGEGVKFDDGYNKTKFTNVGIDAGIKIHVKPHVNPDGFIVLGFDVGGTTGGTVKYKQNGMKDRMNFSLNDNDNKAFAGLTGGVGVTVRTDVLDLTVQATVTGGLNQIFDDNNDNTPRRVPIFGEIPFIIRFFGKQKQKERENLLIFITPTIIDSTEED